MNQQPPCEPDKQDFQTAIAKAEQLYQLTQAILSQSTNPNLPELGQLILRRGNLLGELSSLKAEQFSASQQAELEAKLQTSKVLDADIEKNLRQIHAGLDAHIKELKENRALVNKYKLSDESEQGTRSTNA